jgi:hypothetical protein
VNPVVGFLFDILLACKHRFSPIGVSAPLREKALAIKKTQRSLSRSP